MPSLFFYIFHNVCNPTNSLFSQLVLMNERKGSLLTKFGNLNSTIVLHLKHNLHQEVVEIIHKYDGYKLWNCINVLS